ncbi:MAG: hypothetical protein M1587_06940 [Thaumarchaeota archaeon]|nr:hypothetical protein [Nitrososphaerota archaeon]
MTNRNIRASAKLFVVVIPIVLMLASIALYQVYFTGNPSQDPPLNTQQLQLVGGYSNTIEPSLTLSDVGNSQLTILQVVFDGRPLSQGIIGGAVPMFGMDNNSSFCEVSTNSLIFPQAQHWNMDTGGLCSATILPNGVATLYLGVFSETQSSNILLIFTDKGNYSFFL